MTETAAPPPDPSPPEHSTKPGQVPGFCAPDARKWILVAAILGSAMGFIDGTIVAIALPAMRGTFDASLSQGQWINNAYMLPLAALILLGGALGDRFGLARSFKAGLVLFVLGSLACAVAPTADLLIAARCFKGIGAAIMIPQSLALISRAYPPEARGQAIGIWAAASALTTALGPVLGGAVLSLGGPDAWRWLFAANLPLGALALWMLSAHVRNDPAQRDRPLDWPGACLATLGLGLVAMGLTGGPSGASPGLTLAGGIGLVAFVLFERQSRHPMMPLSLFRNPTFAAANLVTFTLYFALSAILFFLPMTVISGWGVDEASASAALAPMALLIAALSTRTGAWAKRVGTGRLIALGSAIVAACFAGQAATASLMAFWAITVPLSAGLGLGMGLVVGPLSTAVMSALPEDRAATGSAINNAVSRMAGLIAVAAMGTLASVTYRAAGGGGSFGALAADPAHVMAMNAGFAVVAWTTAGLAALAAALAYRLIRP